MRTFVSLFVLSLIVSAHVSAQKKSAETGIVNALATSLPKPDYPEKAKQFCAGGKVEIEVLISETGDVLEARPISGDVLLREASVEAVKKAKFRQKADGGLFRQKGIVVYRFDSFAKCLNAGIVNKKAEFIPAPDFPKACRCVGKVVVEVMIDTATGKVAAARALSGHPLRRGAALKSARKALFSPAFIDRAPIRVKARLVYQFGSGGAVRF